MYGVRRGQEPATLLQTWDLSRGLGFRVEIPGFRFKGLGSL